MTYYGGGSAPAVPMNGMRSPTADAAMPLRTEVLRQRAAVALTRGYRWLEQAVPVAPAATSLVSGLVIAVSLYAAQQYEACLAQAVSVFQAIERLRGGLPGLPQL